MTEHPLPTASTSKLIIHYPPKLWLGNISKKFHYANIKITAFVPIQQDPFVGNSMISIQSNLLEKILADLENEPSLLAYSIMERDNNAAIISTRTKDNLLLRAIVKSFILVKLPVKVYDGKAEFIVNGTRSNIDEFIADLYDHGIKVDIMNLGQFSDNLKNLQLTSRQYEVYQEARKLGYYDHPRKLTLTALADHLGMAKSSLSSMLQRIHNALLGN